MIDFLIISHTQISIFLLYSIWILCGLAIIYNIIYGIWCWIEDREYRGYLIDNHLYENVIDEIGMLLLLSFILSFLCLMWFLVLVIIGIWGMVYLIRHTRRRQKEGETFKEIYENLLTTIKSYIKIGAKE